LRSLFEGRVYEEKGMEMGWMIFTKFSQQKCRKDLEAMCEGVYLCPPLEKRG
jgi:hypothetical protein